MTTPLRGFSVSGMLNKVGPKAYIGASGGRYQGQTYCARTFDHYAFQRNPKNRAIMPKIMLVSDHYARVLLAETDFAL